MFVSYFFIQVCVLLCFVSSFYMYFAVIPFIICLCVFLYLCIYASMSLGCSLYNELFLYLVV